MTKISGNFQLKTDTVFFKLISLGEQSIKSRDSLKQIYPIILVIGKRRDFTK